MTAQEIIGKIRAEIERLQHTDTPHTDEWWDGADYVRRRMKEVLSDLEKSEKPSEGLEEEMDKFFETMPVLEHENIFEDTFKNIARHFAKWGAEHLKKNK